MNVLVCSGCYNRLPQTGGLLKRNVLYLSSEDLKSMIKVTVGLMSGENFPLGWQTAPSCCVLTWHFLSVCMHRDRKTWQQEREREREGERGMIDK